MEDDFNPIKVYFNDANVHLESNGQALCLKCGVKDELTQYKMPMPDCSCTLVICFCSACRKIIRDNTKEFVKSRRNSNG